MSLAICAHPARQEHAERLGDELGATIAYDMGAGPLATHDAALKVAMETEADWYVILEDDAEPIAGFRREASKALDACPEKLASLYLGTGRPPQYQAQLKRMSRVGVHWATAATFLHGVCMAFHHDVAAKILERAEENAWPADQRYGWAGQCLGLRVAHSFPSLVDHADGEPLVEERLDGDPRDVPRRAWWVGGREVWDRSRVEVLRG